MSDIYSYFIIFFPLNINFIYSAWHGPKSVQFGQSAQFDGGFNIYEWGWTGVKIQSSPSLKEGVLRGPQRKICPFFESIGRKSKVVYHIQKSTHQVNVEGDMGLPLPFNLKKVLFLPYLASKLG